MCVCVCIHIYIYMCVCVCVCVSVLTNRLYGCETWTTYQQQIKKLRHFHMTCLRKIFAITRQKHIADTKVFTRVSPPSIYTILMQSQLRWAGHVVLMKYHSLSKKLLYGELSLGKHSQRGQKNDLKHTVSLHAIFQYRS